MNESVRRVKPFPDCHCGHAERGHTQRQDRDRRRYRPCNKMGCRCRDYQAGPLLPQMAPRGPERAVGREKPASRPVKRGARHGLRTAILGANDVISRAEYDRIAGQTMSEETWRQHIRDYAYTCGFKRQYHTHRSDRSDPGWPDDVMGNGLGRMLIMEAKKEGGELTWDQISWLDEWAMIRDAGNQAIEVYVPRPSDRDDLWNTLAGNSLQTFGVVTFLHQWCLVPACQRCMRDRDNATLIIRGRGGRIVQTIRRAKARGYLA